MSTGLPSFEMSISDLVPALQNQLAPLDQAFLAATGTDPGFRISQGIMLISFLRENQFIWDTRLTYHMNHRYDICSCRLKICISKKHI